MNSYREPKFRYFFPKIVSSLVVLHAKTSILDYLLIWISEETNHTAKY